MAPPFALPTNLARLAIGPFVSVALGITTVVLETTMLSTEVGIAVAGVAVAAAAARQGVRPPHELGSSNLRAPHSEHGNEQVCIIR